MRYPRSFLGLLLAGFTLVALPLVGALAYSAWHTERLAEQSRSAVYSAERSTLAEPATRIVLIAPGIRWRGRGLMSRRTPRHWS